MYVKCLLLRNFLQLQYSVDSREVLLTGKNMGCYIVLHNRWVQYVVLTSYRGKNAMQYLVIVISKIRHCTVELSLVPRPRRTGTQLMGEGGMRALAPPKWPGYEAICNCIKYDFYTYSVLNRSGLSETHPLSSASDHRREGASPSQTSHHTTLDLQRDTWDSKALFMARRMHVYTSALCGRYPCVGVQESPGSKVVSLCTL